MKRANEVSVRPGSYRKKILSRRDAGGGELEVLRPAAWVTLALKRSLLDLYG